jgi:hypothetical protein
VTASSGPASRHPIEMRMWPALRVITNRRLALVADCAIAGRMALRYAAASASRSAIRLAASFSNTQGDVVILRQIHFWGPSTHSASLRSKRQAAVRR